MQPPGLAHRRPRLYDGGLSGKYGLAADDQRSGVDPAGLPVPVPRASRRPPASERGALRHVFGNRLPQRASPGPAAHGADVDSGLAVASVSAPRPPAIGGSGTRTG